MPKTNEVCKDLIERAYWALVINALEPIEDCYPQDDISELIDQLSEYLNG